MADKEEFADGPLESVTTYAEDGFPQDYSAMDSVGMATENGLGGDDADFSATDASGSEGRASNQALAAARAHLQAVAEELATIQNQFGSSPEADKVAAAAAAAAAEAAAEAEAAAQGQGDENQKMQDLEREKRHLEVDLECANAKADRLANEKEELLGAQARMEGDLRNARKLIEELRLRQQHRDMDLRAKGGASASAALPDSLADVMDSSDKPAPAPLREVAEQAGLAPRPAIALSKQQAVAALRAAQAELREERKRRERLERRVVKDKERLERLVAVAESQQMEIRTLNMRCWQSEASAQDCMGRLQDSVAHSSALQMALQGPRPGSRGSNDPSEAGGMKLATPPFGGRPGNSAGGNPAMLRQQSAPTRLPQV